MTLILVLVIFIHTALSACPLNITETYLNASITTYNNAISLKMNARTGYNITSVSFEYFSEYPTPEQLEYLINDPVYDEVIGVDSMQFLDYYQNGAIFNGKVVFLAAYVKVHGADGDFNFWINTVDGEVLELTLTICAGSPDKEYGNGLCCDCPEAAYAPDPIVYFPHCQGKNTESNTFVTQNFLGTFAGGQVTISINYALEGKKFTLGLSGASLTSPYQFNFYYFTDNPSSGCPSYVKIFRNSTSTPSNDFTVLTDILGSPEPSCGTTLYIGIIKGSDATTGAHLHSSTLSPADVKSSTSTCGTDYPLGFISFPLFVSTCCDIALAYDSPVPVEVLEQQLHFIETKSHVCAISSRQHILSTTPTLQVPTGEIDSNLLASNSFEITLKGVKSSNMNVAGLTATLYISTSPFTSCGAITTLTATTTTVIVVGAKATFNLNSILNKT
jgi:hypothetical protein